MPSIGSLGKLGSSLGKLLLGGHPEILGPSYIYVSASSYFILDAISSEPSGVFASAENSIDLFVGSSARCAYRIASSNSMALSSSLSYNTEFKSVAGSIFSLYSRALAPTVYLVDAASSFVLDILGEQGVYRVSAANFLMISPSIMGSADRFASASNRVNLKAQIALGGGFTYAVSAFNNVSFKSTARSPMEYFVAARNSIILVGTTGSYTSPIRVSASNSFALSTNTSTKGPIYVSASNSFKLFDTLALKHLHVYRVSAANSFRMSPAASCLNYAIHNVSAASNFALGSAASSVLEMNASASSGFVMAATSSQTRDVYAGAATAFSLQSLPGSNNFYQLDASSTAEFFASTTAITTGELAENRLALASFAFASVEFPWRRTTLTLPPGGGLPHS
ncbi:hypothetical protein SAMN05444166_4237 [Singulisphaera sp. GP187]|uniref:hypothetical protein n=1 Tax=Singulisphaera sp. GP187 TaxID=1882752 RepID=UPI0009275210|nr:hypothetical protein [Singulisphaera sp. GP187]SIO38046.1 hypothetical protein SAMN05444166_4237 [Singulisphaera sp. GP187]